MESPKSLKITTGTFIFFLTVCAVDHVDSLYIPLKQSIYYQHIPETCIYAAELLAFIILGVSLVKVVRHISRQQFFVKQNVNCFKVMGMALVLPPLVKTLGSIVGVTDDWRAVHMNIEIWIAAALFMLIIANIFGYGKKLKEEQDLTI